MPATTQGGGGAAVGVGVPATAGSTSSAPQQQLQHQQQQHQVLLQQHQGLMPQQQQQQQGGLSVQLGNGTGAPDVAVSISQPKTVVDRLAAMVAGGGPAANNLGRLAGSVSAQLGFRAPGSMASADSTRSYLSGAGGTAQDADLRAAAASLGFERGRGAASPTSLRSAGQTLGRQANTAFEAMAAAADTSQGNPSVMRDVISHQLGPMPRLLDGLVSGCAAVAPAASCTSAGGGMMSLPNNKRPKEDCLDDDDRPGKKVARGDLDGDIGVSGGQLTSMAAGDGSQDTKVASDAGVGTGTTAGSENGGGASLSPAAAAPPASNLLARPAAADFRHGGGEELMALLKAKVGRLFSLDAEYTHVRRGVPENNGAPAARGTEGNKNSSSPANRSSTATSAAVGTAESGGDVNSGGAKADGLRRVLSRLKAVRQGHFVVYVKFDVPGNEFRPCDVCVLSWGEAGEVDNGNGGSLVKTDCEGEGPRSVGSFMDSMDGSKPWRTTQHTAFGRVSSHAFQVGLVSFCDFTKRHVICTNHLVSYCSPPLL